MRTKTVMVAALAALLAACSGDPTGPAAPAGVELAVRSTAYRAGDTLRLELRNTGGEAVGFNLCYSFLERRDTFGWEVDEDHFPPTPCLDILHSLRPGETASGIRLLPAGLRAGTYRVRTSVSVGPDRGGVVRTQAFRVQR